MAGNTIGGKKAAAKNLASNRTSIKSGRKGKLSYICKSWNLQRFAQDIECDCDLIDGPHFVKNVQVKRDGRISQTKIKRVQIVPSRTIKSTANWTDDYFCPPESSVQLATSILKVINQ